MRIELDYQLQRHNLVEYNLLYVKDFQLLIGN